MVAAKVYEMQTMEHNPSQAAMGEDEQRTVRVQMERMLESHQFRNSRRYPALLRFIVEETLEGRGDLLKERLIGIHVFGRPADYDTANDPIVRVNIAEVRKRIAQYYHDEEHDAEIRIELVTGRYAPEFRPRREHARDAALEEAAATPAATIPAFLPSAMADAEPQKPERTHSRPRVWPAGRGLRTLLLVAAALLLGLSWAAWRWVAPTAREQFWAPLLGSGSNVMFCLPTDVASHNPSATPLIDDTPSAHKVPGPTFFDHESLGENVVYSDMMAMLAIVNILNLRHIDYNVRLNINTTLEDLRHGPDVLIGGLDNQWTLRAIDKLPYRFAGSDEDRWWIADTRHPQDRTWSLDTKEQYAAVTHDYAIIARLHNEQTGEPEVIIAGIGMSGTAAAGEMVADEQLMGEARRRIGAGFKTRDFEIVISTDVVNGIAGSPRILAVSVW